MKIFKYSILIFPTLLFTFSCAHLPSKRLNGYQCIPCYDIAAAAGNSFTTVTLSGKKLLYQLQDASADDISDTGFDIVVMDYSSDGTESSRYSSGEMESLKSGGRQVLSYLSVGEAEDYRYYFDSGWVSPKVNQPNSSAPCWLARTNPDWKGNYKVQYWSDAWQGIILEYLDKIIDDGFDGVYLDIIDAFEYWSDSDNGEGYHIAEDEAAVRMINFVKRIAYHARITRAVSGFLIVPQNGEEILQYDTGIDDLGPDDYLETISAIGIEDLYYNETAVVSRSITEARKEYLNRIQEAGKKVLVVDYVDNGSRPVKKIVNTFRSNAIGDGFLPYAARTDRALDKINTFSGQP